MNKEEKPITPLKKILFFGFYTILFFFLFIFINNLNKIQKEERDKKYIIYKTDLIDNHPYEYNYTITSNEGVITYHGYSTDEAHDYANDPNSNFLEFNNVKQLLKNSKIIDFVGEEDKAFYNMELNNKDISKIYEGNSEDKVNKIKLHVNSDYELIRVELDLSEYFGYQYQLDLKYEVLYE